MIENQHLPAQKHTFIYSRQQSKNFNKVDACQKYFTFQSYQDYKPDIKNDFINQLYNSKQNKSQKLSKQKQQQTNSNKKQKNIPTTTTNESCTLNSNAKLATQESNSSNIRSSNKLQLEQQNQESDSIYDILNKVRIKKQPSELDQFIKSKSLGIYKKNITERPQTNQSNQQNNKNNYRYLQYNSMKSSQIYSPKSNPNKNNNNDGDLRISQFLLNYQNNDEIQQQSQYQSQKTIQSSKINNQQNPQQIKINQSQNQSQQQNIKKQNNKHYYKLSNYSKSSFQLQQQQKQQPIPTPKQQNDYISQRNFFSREVKSSYNQTRKPNKKQPSSLFTKCKSQEENINLVMLQSDQKKFQKSIQFPQQQQQQQQQQSSNTCNTPSNNDQNKFSQYIQYLKSMDSLEQNNNNNNSLFLQFQLQDQQEQTINNIPSFDFYRDKIKSEQGQRYKIRNKQTSSKNQQQQLLYTYRNIQSPKQQIFNNKTNNFFSPRSHQNNKKNHHNHLQAQNLLLVKPGRVKSPLQQQNQSKQQFQQQISFNNREKTIKLQPYDLTVTKENDFDQLIHNRQKQQQEKQQENENNNNNNDAHNQQGTVLKVFFEDYAYGLKTIDKLKQSKVKSKQSLRRLFGFNDEIHSVILTSEDHEKNSQQKQFTSENLKTTFFEEVYNQFEKIKEKASINIQELQLVKIQTSKGTKEVPAELLWDQYQKLSQMHEIIIEYLDGKEKTKLTKAKSKILSEIVAVHTREKYYSKKGQKKKLEINTKEIRDIQKDMEFQHSTTRSMMQKINSLNTNNGLEDEINTNRIKQFQQHQQ